MTTKKTETQEPVAPPTPLATRLVAAMGEIGALNKGGSNTAQNYKYVTSEDVLSAVRGALWKHGIFFICGVDSVTREESRSGKQYLVTLKMTMVFCCGETGEKMEAPWYAEAADSGDKAINKAQTAAVKYFLLKTFLIPTSDEPDADQRSPELLAQKDEESLAAYESAKSAIEQATTGDQLNKIADWLRTAPLTNAHRQKLRDMYAAAVVAGRGPAGGPTFTARRQLMDSAPVQAKGADDEAQ